MQTSRPYLRALVLLAAAGLVLAALFACSDRVEADSSGLAAEENLLAGSESLRTLPPLDLGGATAYDAAARKALGEAPPEEWDDLHNVYFLSENVISGGEPLTREALGRVAGMGVKTILSVDGKAPDHEAAAELGMGYVHVPIHYATITEQETLEIAKTFYELEGPFYVHCFHGKHRGPAAAALGRMILDDVDRETALAEMRQWCGTSSKYEGLYEVVASDAIPSREEAAAYDWDFPPARSFSGLRQGMIEATRSFDNLELARRNDWQPDPDHPDILAENEARILAENFEAAARSEEVRAYGGEFETWMIESAREVRELEKLAAAVAGGDEKRVLEADAALDQIKSSCNLCHAAYRNED